jgi:acyl-coenzyme A thioesterase PaaI-like protein
MKINLLAPGRDGPLRAVGSVEKCGARLVIVRADVFDGDVKVALMQGTMVPVRA